MAQLFCPVRRDRAKFGKKKRRSQLIFIGIIAAVAAGIAYGVYSYTGSPLRTANFGAVGSAHEHAVFRFFINGQEVDFSQPQYQLKSRYIHFEGGDGDTIHKHATNVDLGFLFETMGMKFTNECITMDNGTQYCNDGNNTLKFFVNGGKNDMYNNYVLKDNDKILISYGSEDLQKIREQLNVLDGLVLQK